jgi:hypothetical protein
MRLGEPYRYFRRSLESNSTQYFILREMGHWRSTMRELSAEARPHQCARSLSGRTGFRVHLVAFYSALALIAAIVVGTLSVRPF